MGQVLIIAGMHRSGTSLIASIMREGGVQIGENLLGPGTQNPRGFFEDVDFKEFQDQVLRDRGRDALAVADLDIVLQDAEIATARALVDARRDRDLWGWKDPRTVLLLDFWHQLLPEARYLLLYRHPLEVLVSLVKRGDFLTRDLVDRIEAWYEYNARIKDFFERHPEVCLLCHVHGAVGQIDELRALIQRRLGIELAIDAATRDRLYHPGELQQLAIDSGAAALLAMVHPRALQLYAELDRMAQLPSETANGAERAVANQLQPAFDLCPWRYRSHAHLLLFWALTRVDPELAERFFREHTDYVRALEQKERELWSQVQQASELLASDRAWIKELERGKAWAEEQQQHWQRQAEERAQIIQRQQAWIAELERGKAWAEEQQQHWQRQAEERAQVIQRQQACISALEQALVQAEEQRQHWQRQAEEHQQQASARALHLAEIDQIVQLLQEQLGHKEQVIRQLMSRRVVRLVDGLKARAARLFVKSRSE